MDTDCFNECRRGSLVRPFAYFDTMRMKEPKRDSCQKIGVRIIGRGASRPNVKVGPSVTQVIKSSFAKALFKVSTFTGPNKVDLGV